MQRKDPRNGSGLGGKINSSPTTIGKQRDGRSAPLCSLAGQKGGEEGALLPGITPLGKLTGRHDKHLKTVWLKVNVFVHPYIWLKNLVTVRVFDPVLLPRGAVSFQ